MLSFISKSTHARRVLVAAVLLRSVVLPAQNANFHHAPDSARRLSNPYEGQQGAQLSGKKLYASRCASCHGSHGEGSGNVPTLAGKLDSVTAGELFWFITTGDANNGMPAWAILPEQQRWQIVSYIRSPAMVQTETENSVLPAEAVTTSKLKAPPPLAPFTDFRYEEPGRVHKITVSDLPQPYATRSADNGPKLVSRPAKAWPKAPTGFKVEQYATGLNNPRLMRTAPNGDIFVAETDAGDIRVFRGMTGEGKPEQLQIFARGLQKPYGIAFYPPGPDPHWLYVGEEKAVMRFAYQKGDLKAGSAPQHIADLPGGEGHSTRDIRFTADGKKMFVAVGSASNDDDPDHNPDEKNRADILQFNPDGSSLEVYAYGIRNAGGGLAIHPQTGELWCSVNERDALGDNLVPDYITHVQAGGFYGWPWWYIGGHQDPRQKGKHPELKDKVIVPDVFLQPHNASLELAFYEGKQFPGEYEGDIFASEHGSWNKAIRTGYEVIRVPLHGTTRASGEYQDFLTGFVLDDGNVWGRPVGIAVAPDGSLLVSDDGSNSVWRVSYSRK